MALACGLRDQGHRVAVLYDVETAQIIATTGLPTITFPQSLHGKICPVAICAANPTPSALNRRYATRIVGSRESEVEGHERGQAAHADVGTLCASGEKGVK